LNKKIYLFNFQVSALKQFLPIKFPIGSFLDSSAAGSSSNQSKFLGRQRFTSCRVTLRYLYLFYSY